MSSLLEKDEGNSLSKISSNQRTIPMEVLEIFNPERINEVIDQETPVMDEKEETQFLKDLLKNQKEYLGM